MTKVKALKRPIESDYTSHVAYTRALEEYCDSLLQPDHFASVGNKVKQEPVAHIYYLDSNSRPRVGWDNWAGMKLGDKLYASPQSAWVDLTDEEVDQFHNWKDCTWSTNELVRYVEAQLKAKNA